MQFYRFYQQFSNVYTYSYTVYSIKFKHINNCKQISVSYELLSVGKDYFKPFTYSIWFYFQIFDIWLTFRCSHCPNSSTTSQSLPRTAIPTRPPTAHIQKYSVKRHHLPASVKHTTGTITTPKMRSYIEYLSFSLG